jgi:[acyl-carrier-protein] S-malonyltransferase
MGRDLYDAYESVRERYRVASDILGLNLAQLSFDGPEDELKQTRVTQPAIFVHSAVLTEILQARRYRPSLVAGHSLGEYSALFAAGALSFVDALKLVKVRGELMQQAGEINAGAMAAIIGLEPEVLRDVCDEAAANGVVQVANYNSPGQIVISGSVSGVERAIVVAQEKGAKKAVPLVVSGAFHSPLMEFAREGLTEALAQVRINPAEVPVFSNVTAGPVSQPTDIQKYLLEQLTCPVRWTESIQNMIGDGANVFYEVGPGSVLKGLLKRISRDTECRSINSVESLAEMA